MEDLIALKDLPPEERFYRFARQYVFPSLLERDREGRFDREIWKALGSLGLFNPEMRLEDQIQAFIGLARGGLDIPLCLSAIAHGAVAVELLRKFGNEAQKARFLRDMVEGNTIAAVCNAEEKAGTDVKGIESKLVLDTEAPESEMYQLDLNKRGATNLSYADVVFASVWRKRDLGEPSLEVVVLDGKTLVQESHVDKLVGFKTGITGSARTAETIPIRKEDCQLGPDLNGYKVLKHCFNIERLFIPAILTGVLEGLLQQAVTFVEERKTFGKAISEYQYVQEKVIAIFAKKERMLALIQRIVGSRDGLSKSELAPHSKTLALLKMSAVEDSVAAATQFYELFGYQAYKLDHLAQKTIRDVLALKMLGGTKEQQKIILFQELMKEYGRRPEASSSSAPKVSATMER